MRRATAELVRRYGDPAIALYIPLDVAETLEATLPKGFAKLGVKLAKSRPDLFAPLLAAGWKPKARAG